MIYKLTPGLRQGTIDNRPEPHSGITRIELDFHDIAEPVVIELVGDMEGPLRGRRVSVFGSLEAPEDMEATEAFVAHLRANASGWVHRTAFDDDRGFELSWRDVRHEVVAGFRATYGKRRDG